jgi:hypothetical protein
VVARTPTNGGTLVAGRISRVVTSLVPMAAPDCAKAVCNDVHIVTLSATTSRRTLSEALFKYCLRSSRAPEGSGSRFLKGQLLDAHASFRLSSSARSFSFSRNDGYTYPVHSPKPTARCVRCQVGVERGPLGGAKDRRLDSDQVLWQRRLQAPELTQLA